MKPYILFFTFLLCSANVLATWQRTIKHYYRSEYHSGNQNWMIAQQANGWMYFANNKGLLELDGNNSVTYPVHNTKLRSVAVGDDGRIYVGAMGQFGYFVPNRVGGIDYTCLSDSLDEGVYVGIIYNIHIVDKRVYFQSEHKIFCLENGEVEVLKASEEISCSAVINNRFYVALQSHLAVLNGKELVPIGNSNRWLNRSGKPIRVIRILPWNGNLLLVTSEDGLFVLDGNNCTPYRSKADSFIASNLLFSAASQGDLLALGSVQDGVLLLNGRTGEVEHISLENGLQNKTVLDLFFDNSHNLWLGLDNGIDCIELKSPIFSLYGGRANIGSGYAACRYAGNLYLGTNQGLFRTSVVTASIPTNTTFIPGTAGQVWSLQNLDNKLFCGHDKGIFIIDGNRCQYMNQPRGVWNVFALPGTDNCLLAGTYTGLCLLRKSASGEWRSEGYLKGFLHSCKSVCVEGSRTIWVANKGDGIFRLTLSEGLDTLMRVKNYSHAPLSNNYNSYIAWVNGRITIAANEGLFYYDQIKDQLVPDTELEARLDGHGSYNYIREDKNRNIWYVTDGKLKVLRYWKEKEYYKNSGEYFFQNGMIENFENMFLDNDGRAVVSTEDGFSLLKYNEVEERRPLKLQIRKIFSTQQKDLLLYGESYLPNNNPEIVIPYLHNSIRIEFTVNDCARYYSVLYSCRLSGSTENRWTQYSENSMKEYTDLHEGHYVFTVKAITVGSEEPVTVSIAFTVLPPWYRSWWAYMLYSLACAVVLYVVYQRMVMSKKRIIQLKEQELSQQQITFQKEKELKDQQITTLEEQKLQAELLHKSEELIRTTLNIVHKNEILQDIRKVAMGISHSVNDENLVAIRRKTLTLIGRIDADLDNEDHWKNFQNTFDSVHYNFFALLDKRFPGLTYKEKMLCAYIKMNLLSKEIAPLLNITLRGVEINRYRLRKKFGLKEGETLVNFLMHLS